ncbi:hypothetical protein BTM25_30120 [Actinomadura rubteroloni]|uniref:Uncharacterized protein n=1 Tax=Actinomadura rubteroloni TaxID=1926885 RepID=A0A2P4UH39_9ACTN|nr:hypothetical protein [Actinomadura rubteroloni]POM24383.1 hypothetical protein BTM25_30120 [Actinomadura rubteroloni]
MLTSAAVCPHPPVLVPELSGAAPGDALPALRAACRDAVARLSGDLLVVVGGGERTRTHEADASGTLRPYGLDLVIGDAATPELPLSLTVGRRLLGRAPDLYQEIAFDAPPGECLRVGAALAQRADRVALLVLGDASASRWELALGDADGRAGPFDTAVADALGAADAAALAALDPATARAVRSAGRAAWQVLAGAAGTAPLHGELLAAMAPYDVTYLVASWTS